jgi:hypothetical protein
MFIILGQAFQLLYCSFYKIIVSHEIIGISIKCVFRVTDKSKHHLYVNSSLCFAVMVQNNTKNCVLVRFITFFGLLWQVQGSEIQKTGIVSIELCLL